MFKKFLLTSLPVMLCISPAYAISSKYAQQLERSGCTQVSETQGCDIHKSKADNAKAGFIVSTTVNAAQKLSYKQKLERSGCTQLSEINGCDINKTRAENNVTSVIVSTTPFSGNWVAVAPAVHTIVANIYINDKNMVWVNGNQVNAKKSDDTLVFKTGTITYSIQGKHYSKGKNVWKDSDAGTSGPIEGKAD